jgi:RHS repeat-associated protein
MSVKKLFVIFACGALGAFPALANSSVEYSYDQYGNCTTVTTKNSAAQVLEQTTYEYDAYRRCTVMRESAHTTQSRKWNWYYDRYFDSVGLLDASRHTSKQWRVQVEPAYDASGNRRLSAHKFDYQDQITEESSGLYEAADGTWHAGPDTEVHYFTYDKNGSKASSTDPQGRLTTYEYDLRNRLWRTHETVNTIPRTTETLYDPTNNKTDVTFPDGQSQHWQNYDGFSQAGIFIDERGNHTELSYIWGPMKKLYSVTTHRDKDGGGTEDQRTWFSYDLMGRSTRIDFPDGDFANGSYEQSTYEFGQLKTFRTRKGQVKTITYDARGRQIGESVSGDMPAPAITRSWDDANRALTLCNVYSTIDFAYDGAGLVLREGNTIAGSGGRTQTNYWRYADGNVSDVQYPDGISIHRDYTSRGQLKSVRDSLSSQPVIDYTYLSDGKVDHADYRNGVRTAYAYDGRGMIHIVDHYRIGGSQDLSWREYTRDERDRIISFKKGTSGYNPMENGRGDRFRYDAEGQVAEAWYNATDPANSANGYLRSDYFDYDALGNRRGWNYVASRAQWMIFTRKNNGLNQYHTWGPNPVNYDDDIGGTWGQPHLANGVVMQDGNVTAGFNSLNQLVLVQGPSQAGTSNWTFFGYDPLGRRVKQWVGVLDPNTLVPMPGSGPATYFYYDGWNLIQDGASFASASRNYIHGARVDEIVKQITPNNWWERYFHYDARGHCTLQTDAFSNIVEQYEYDAFGYPYFYNGGGTNIGYSPWGNRFLFTGREWLSDLKLYDYRNRIYQPELGRFMQPDPKHFGAGDYNLYRYCHNDPVNKADPMGLLDVILEEYKRIPFSNLKELVRTKFEAFNSLVEAGRAGGKAAGPAALSDHRERYGGVARVLNTRLYIYGHPVMGTHDQVHNYSALRTAPLPNGVERVGGYWVLGRHQDTHSWPVNRFTGKSDGQVLRETHFSAVMTNPPSPGANSLNNQYTSKWYDAETNREGQ